MEADVLITNGRKILEQVRTSAAKYGYTLPVRQYVTVGGSVFDCEQVVVSAIRAGTGVVESESADALALVGPKVPVWNVTYEVSIVRTAAEKVSGPRGDILPTPGQIEADAAVVSTIFAILDDVVVAMSDAIDGVGRLRASFEMGQPEGGLIAGVMTVTSNLWW